VYGIIKQSGGSIWVYSEPDHGTTFKIYLPRVDEPVSPSEDKPVEHGRLRGSETVLVVEDDESVRQLTCTALRTYGYEIIEAANAGEALLACEKRERTPRLMITDVVMPQMSGRELADRLRPLRPEMRVIYMSGYTDDAIVRHGLLDPFVYFLQNRSRQAPWRRFAGPLVKTRVASRAECSLDSCHSGSFRTVAR
jgi:two-component system cell cycle sensor histidine kinase/response regulator CckA